ncbi:alpha/beta fold hydrolase [Corallincola platygyrae]|uniref:Alpha/beta fold hydrolase n=1 Tax=Corallincola platygyrae TaxID=1193278 RepID=A0ABW4XQR7_9GAMM
MSELRFESLEVTPVSGVTLHLRHIVAEDQQPPQRVQHEQQERQEQREQRAKKGAVLFIHGSIENGRIFYSNSGRGLACYLARLGYECYVADLRGRGDSKPKVARGADHGQWESVVEDIPALHKFVYDRHPEGVHWVSHSWGGTLTCASLVRFPELRPQVLSQTLFGVKRRITVRSPEYYFKMGVVWQGLAPLTCKLLGYFPAKPMKIGADNEPWGAIWQVTQWTKQLHWRCPLDGFDYADALQSQQASLASDPDSKYQLPRALFLAGQNDRVLGHPTDVQGFADELAGVQQQVTILSRQNGFKNDYGHIDMLVHRDAEQDHFTHVAEWLANSGLRRPD